MKPPDATYVKTEGAGGHWGEFASTTLDDVWGRLEKFYQDRQGVDSAELDVLAERIVTTYGSKMAGMTITVSDPVHLPWSAYEPGDTVNVNLAPKFAKRERRVAAIVVSKGPNDAAPTYDVHFGSPVYSNEAALAQGLRTVLREFRKPVATTSDGEPVTPNFALGGSAPTLVIAANNSSDSTKARADFICFGVDDDLVFQTAISQLTAGGGGRLLVAEGDYYFSNTVQLNTSIRIEGMGVGATRIHMADGANASMFNVPGSPGGKTIEFVALDLDGNDAQQTAGTSFGIIVATDALGSLHVDQCGIHNFRSSSVGSNRSASDIRITDSHIHDNTEYGLDLFREGRFTVSGNYIRGNGAWGITADGANTLTVENNWIEGNVSGGFTAGGINQNPGVKIIGNTFASNGGDGISLNGGGDIISSNWCYLNTGYGIECDGVAEPSVVVGNFCRGNGLSGIRITGFIGGTCAGNVVFENDRHGIHVGGEWLVTGNRVEDNGRVTNNTYDGIFVDATIVDAAILTNTIRQDVAGNKQRYGINISAASTTNILVAGNDTDLAARFGTGKYNDAGTGTRNTWAGVFGDNH